MPYCSQCGTDVGNAAFCPNCGIRVEGTMASPPYEKPVPRRGGGVQYDSTICLVICCCLSPIAALIYYLLTEHVEQQYTYYDDRM